MADNFKLQGGTVAVTSITDRTAQVLIYTTEDKLELCSRDHMDKVKKGHGYQTPLGMLLTLIPTLVTADFKPAFGISATEIKAGFQIVSIFVFFWLLHSLVNLYKSRGKGPSDFLNLVKSRELN